MKFLLVALNAKYIHSNPALHSLRSYALSQDARAAQEVEIAEYTINQQMMDILTDIYRRKPYAAAFSCYIWNWTLMKSLVTELHKLMPGLPIWLGGPEVSFHSEQILEGLPFVRGIMVGEGEVTFMELWKHYREATEAQLRLEDIPGIVYRDCQNGKILRNPERELTDIGGLPFLYGDLSLFENRILYYESSRGCPFRCSYCLSSIDKKVRLRDLSLVKKELQFFLDNKVPQVKFVDRTFNCNKNHAMEIWNYILEHDNGVTNFHFEIAADLLDDTQLELLSRMRPGLVQLEIGVQSTNERTLHAVRRYTDIQKLGRTVAEIRKGQNIHVHLDLIAGLPHEGLESFARSFNEVYRMEPEQLQLGFLKVLKGSHAEEMAQEWGIESLSEPPYEVLYTKWLSFEDIVLLKKVEAMVEMYYNSNQFCHVLPVLEKCFAKDSLSGRGFGGRPADVCTGPFGMYLALAEFFEEKGYFVNSPSRAYRYQVFLDFAVRMDPQREALYRELLVYDMYLRENLKSRPAFAKDLSGHHDRIVDFYKQEAQNRALLPGYDGYDARQLQRMTHLEVFDWPVNRLPKEVLAVHDAGQKNEKTAILFDYKERSPLNGDARTVVLNVSEEND